MINLQKKNNNNNNRRFPRKTCCYIIKNLRSKKDDANKLDFEPNI